MDAESAIPVATKIRAIAAILAVDMLHGLAGAELRSKKTLRTAQSTVDELLRIAIEHRRIIRLRYRNKDRIVEPHDYGIQNGRVRLLTYQIGGSSTGPLPNWRWMDVELISGLQLLDQTFKGGRPIPSGKHHKWDQLFIRVAADESPKS